MVHFPISLTFHSMIINDEVVIVVIISALVFFYTCAQNLNRSSDLKLSVKHTLYRPISNTSESTFFIIFNRKLDVSIKLYKIWLTMVIKWAALVLSKRHSCEQ